ncbi:MAG TPA: tetratricopeptide repeat protein [Candidatus Acidoferrales bacterium]|nr:tetratricopeptide repeat protein [Candidatus Acidoferrales bacterium]
MGKIVVFFVAAVLLLLTQGPTLHSAEQKPRRVEELYNAGYLLTLWGEYEQALKLYDESLAIQPTAEAYTYKGWTLGQMGEYQRAIEEAQKAIRVDPDFGNPYNDIGVYLMELGRDDEAISYLLKAKAAKRYCCYQFPHFNLGRIYLKKGLYEKARDEFKKALQIDPTYEPAQAGLELLKQLGFEPA